MTQFSNEIGQIIEIYPRNTKICFDCISRIGLSSFINQAEQAGYSYSAYFHIIGAYKIANDYHIN